MGRIILFIAVICMLVIIGVTAYALVSFIKLNMKEARKAKEEAAKEIAHEREKEYKRKKNDNAPAKSKKKTKGSSNFSKCPRCAKRFYCSEYQQHLMDISGENWFPILYPALSADESAKTASGMLGNDSKNILARKSVDKLPDSYRETLAKISERMEQIRARSDNSSIANVLASYCDSIEKSTISYVELLDAPIRSDAIQKTMEEIENAVGEVPATLDAILTSTYENDSMKALIEAGALRAVVEHNRSMFSGDGNFVSDEVSRLLDESGESVEDDQSVQDNQSDKNSFYRDASVPREEAFRAARKRRKKNKSKRDKKQSRPSYDWDC